ncbi:hypothetical protein ACFY3M_53830 [Streptomyces mirabilis]|uniref:hypothetical protein n=1 Tax=Streptomyces mirabilis TaxID=68239 RepID=UPI0036C0E238
MNALENQGLVELACREERAELSGRPVRWATRLTAYGDDTLAYGQSRPRAEPPPGEKADRQAVELIPSQMAAPRVFPEPEPAPDNAPAPIEVRPFQDVAPY